MRENRTSGTAWGVRSDLYSYQNCTIEIETWKNSEHLLHFFSGIGLGGVITFLIKHFLEQRSKLKEIWLLDYKSACDGLLDSYREIALTDSEEASKKFAYWELKLQLYASEAVLTKLKEMKETSPGSDQREKSQRALVREMRKDLGFS